MSDAISVSEDLIKSYFKRWLHLEEEKQAISDDLKELFKEAKGFGFDGKALRTAFNRKVKEDAADPADAEFEMIVDAYVDAINGLARDARLRTREIITKFDAETGEVFDNDNQPETANEMDRDTRSPNAAKSVPAENARKAVPETEDGSVTHAGAGESPATYHDMPCGSCAAGVYHEVAVLKGLEMFGHCETRKQALAEAPRCKSDASHICFGARDWIMPMEFPVSGERRAEMLRNCGVSESAPASQGEAEAHSVESVSPQADEATTGSIDANTGGDHVDREIFAATYQAGGLVNQPPAVPGAIKFETDPPVPMKRSSFGHCFPELSNAAYAELRSSITSVGIQEPIIRKGDVILDGWCRYNIARSLGMEYPVQEYDGSDELLDVIRWQRSSRDWTPAQEAKIAKLLAKELPDRADDIWAAFHIALNDDGEVVAA